MKISYIESQVEAVARYVFNNNTRLVKLHNYQHWYDVAKFIMDTMKDGASKEITYVTTGGFTIIFSEGSTHSCIYCDVYADLIIGQGNVSYTDLEYEERKSNQTS